MFRLLDPKAFESAFRAWVGSILPAFNQVAIDAKSLRGSAEPSHAPLHMVSAFATDAGLVLGQEVVADKSKEISALPALLETLAIKGALVRIDAMGCQRQIAAASGKRGAHGLRTVKNKQRALRSAIEAAFVDVPVAGFEHTERSQGRIVIKHVQVIENRGQVAASAWDGCQRLGRVVSLRVQPGKRQVWRPATTSARHHSRMSNGIRPCASIGKSRTACTGRWR